MRTRLASARKRKSSRFRDVSGRRAPAAQRARTGVSILSGRSLVKRSPTTGPSTEGGPPTAAFVIKPTGRRRSLAVRSATALLAGPPVIAVILAGGGWLLLGLAVFIAAGLREFYGLARRTGAVVVAPTGYALAAILLFLSPGARLLADGLGGIENAGPVRAWVIGILEAGANRWEIAVTLTIVAPLVSLLFKRQASRDRLTGWTVTVVGAWYVTWLLGRVGSLRLLEAPDDRYAGGAGWVMLMVLGTWACDTGAYLVGSRFGRRKMVPWISPGKTWEGALGGAIATVMVVAASTAGMPEAALGFEGLRWRPLPIPWEHVVPLGVGIAIAAILGDLAESMIKRDAGAKDASGLFPGHGGVLDRVDSVLFTAPFTYYYASLLLGQVA